MIEAHQLEPHFSDGDYERLAHLGRFALRVRHDYQYSEAHYPGGGYDSSLEGPPTGIARATLVFRNVARDGGREKILRASEEQSLAWYLWEFFHRHHTPKKKAFIAPHPFTEKDALWRFEEHSLQLDHVARRLWSIDGIPLIQHFNGEPFTDTSENPNTI